MKNWFLISLILYFWFCPQLTFGYSVTTVAPVYYGSNYYGGYGNYPPPPPPPPILVPNVPYNGSTYYNYYNRYPQNYLIGRSLGRTRILYPYAIPNVYYTRNTHIPNKRKSSVRRFNNSSSTIDTLGRVIRYYY